MHYNKATHKLHIGEAGMLKLLNNIKSQGHRYKWYSSQTTPIYHQELHRETARKCHSDGNPTWMGTTPG